MRFSLLFSVLFTLAFLAACRESDSDAVHSENASALQWELDGFRSDLSVVDHGLDSLDERVRKAGDTAAPSLQETLAGLTAQRDKFRQDLQRLEGAGAETFERQHTALEQRLGELQMSVEAANLNAIESREEFQSVAASRLKELGQELTALENALENGPEPAAAHSGAPLISTSDLQEQRRELTEQTMELESAAYESFRERRRQLAEAVAELAREIEIAADVLEQARRERVNETAEAATL